MTHLRIPESLALYPFQIETVRQTLNFLSTTPHGAYVANEQGLGKTITALVTTETLRCAHTIILCPAIMRLVWEEEIYKWCRFSPTSVPKVMVIESAKDVTLPELSDASYVVCSYALASVKEVLQKLLSFRWDMLISDENHFCKTVEAKRTQALFSLCQKAAYKIFMSGTPMTANVVDLFCPCHMLAPDVPVFKSFNSFAERYSNYTEMSVPVFRNGYTQSVLVKKYYGLKNEQELSKTIRERFYIRYKKEKVLTELPPKIFQKIILPESFSVRVQERDREKIIREKQLIFQYLEKGLLPPPCETMAEHRRVQGEKKVAAVAEFVEDKLEEDIPIVLFAHHRNVISALSQALAKYNPAVVTGETSSHEREKLISSFQQGQTNLFIGNMVAAGVGITLTRSSTVVLAELDWIPANIAQAIDRCHRIGAKSQVIVYWFIVKNSLDEQMDELLIRRTKEASLVLD